LKTITKHIRDNLHKRINLVTQPKQKNNYENLHISEWSNKFEKLMRNRLIMGAIRYGKLGEPGKPNYDRIESIIKRAKKFNETGNTEFLVDIANLALVEFVEGRHPKKHFKAIDDGEHVNIK